MIAFQARLQRGNVLLKQGDTDLAKQDFLKVVSMFYSCIVYSHHVHVDKKFGFF